MGYWFVLTTKQVSLVSLSAEVRLVVRVVERLLESPFFNVKVVRYRSPIRYSPTIEHIAEMCADCYLLLGIITIYQ